MKRPAFQFYPADWRKDAALQSCSLAAQGLWINMMCIAHECEPYGHLTVNGKPMSAAQIGRLVGLSQRECEKLLAELQDAGVTSTADDGAILSRRMVRDERVRETRASVGRENGIKGKEFGALGAEHGAKGGRPRKDETPPETPPTEPGQKPPQNPHPSSSSSSSPSGNTGIPPSESPGETVGGPAQSAPTPPSPPPPFAGTNEAAIPPRATVPLAKDFALPMPWGEDAEALGFKPAEILIEAEKFRQYFVAGRGAGTRRSLKGWRQGWSNWLGKAAADNRRSA